MNLCKCGCGGHPKKEGSQYVKGHNTKDADFQRKRLAALKVYHESLRKKVTSVSNSLGILDGVNMKAIALNYVQSAAISKEELMQIVRVGLLKSLNLQKISTIEDTATRIQPVKHKKRAFNNNKIWSEDDLRFLQTKYSIYTNLDNNITKRSLMKLLRKTLGRTTYAIKYQFHKFNQM